MSNLKGFTVVCLLLNMTLIKSVQIKKKFDRENDSSISNTGETKDFQCRFLNSCPRFFLQFYTLNEDDQNTILSHIKELDKHNSQLTKALRVNAFKFIRLLNGSVAINCFGQVQNFTITQSENNSSNDTFKISVQIYEMYSNKFVKLLNPYLFLKCSFRPCSPASKYNSVSWIQDHCSKKTPK